MKLDGFVYGVVGTLVVSLWVWASVLWSEDQGTPPTFGDSRLKKPIEAPREDYQKVAYVLTELKGREILELENDEYAIVIAPVQGSERIGIKYEGEVFPPYNEVAKKVKRIIRVEDEDWKPLSEKFSKEVRK